MSRTIVRIDGERKAVLETFRERLILAMVVVIFCFSALVIRLVDLTVLEARTPRTALNLTPLAPSPPRADILDRNGIVLARSVPATTLAARPALVRNPDETARQIAMILPELSPAYVRERLTSNGRFVLIKRQITPRQHLLINAIGDPGIVFEEESRRIYPNGTLAAHALGFVDADGNGKLGIERYLDMTLKSMVEKGNVLDLALDVRVQHALEDELWRGLEKHSALGAAGLVLDIHSGEVLALASLPDFEPSAVAKSPEEHQLNRATLGIYELGSVFKIFTVAAGLDYGVADLASSYDATKPIRISRFTINDDHPENRWLTLPELMIHSSNIASARLALEIGGDRQRAFLARLGMLEPVSIELDEVAAPRFSPRWGDVQTVTISYGHGIAVSLLHLAQGAAAILNGGTLIRATLLHDADLREDDVRGPRVINPKTSQTLRELMRLVVTDGTGGKADAPGYRVGGKTGTAEKIGGRGGYRRNANVATFLGAFPMDAPRYVVIAMLDEPKGTKDTYNFTSAGWTAAPIVRNTVLRIGPILGVEPGPWDVDLEPVRNFTQASFKG